MSGGPLYAVYMLILFLANVLGAVGGFGAGMISIPFLTQLFDTKTVVMASSMTCILNVFISIKDRHNLCWRELGKIALGMCLGLPFGVLVLKLMDTLTLKLILGIFMVLLGIYGFAKLKIPQVREFKFSKGVLWVCLVAGGVIQGAIASGGCFILMYAQQNLVEKRQFRATLAMLWTVVSLIAILQYRLMGTLTGDAVMLSGIGAPAVLLGIFAGGRLCKRLSQTAFQYLINGIIMAAGLLNCLAVLNAR